MLANVYYGLHRMIYRISPWILDLSILQSANEVCIVIIDIANKMKSQQIADMYTINMSN